MHTYFTPPAVSVVKTKNLFPILGKGGKTRGAVSVAKPKKWFPILGK